MPLHVIDEARRCKQCKVPQCRMKGCPVMTNTPEMMRLLLDGKVQEAGKMLFENNPLSVFCSLVCDHAEQCEGHCIMGKIKDGHPVHISSVENYISENYLARLRAEIPEKNGKQVAVIGAGPAGIVVAVKLIGLGYDVTMFDRMDSMGGMMRYGIPEFRLPRNLLTRYQNYLEAMGIKFRPHTVIGGALHLDDLFSDGYGAVFIGTGVWRPRRLGVPGETLGNCHYAVDYLRNPAAYRLGETVAVIGSGNSAMDAARTAIRYGVRHVTVIALTRESTASPVEVEYAQIDGVEFLYAMSTKAITKEGVLCARRIFDEEGNCTGEEEPSLFRADSVLISVSQGPKDKLVSTTPGLDAHENGLLIVDENGKTTRKGVFAAGDVATGARNVVLAVREAKRVAESIHNYLQGN